MIFLYSNVLQMELNNIFKKYANIKKYTNIIFNTF